MLVRGGKQVVTESVRRLVDAPAVQIFDDLEPA
jgi:hypothetical protein